MQAQARLVIRLGTDQYIGWLALATHRLQEAAAGQRGGGGRTAKLGGMMTGDGLPAAVEAPPAASARLVSCGEGETPSTRKPTTFTGGEVLLSCFFIAAARSMPMLCSARWAGCQAGRPPRAIGARQLADEMQG